MRPPALDAFQLAKLLEDVQDRHSRARQLLRLTGQESQTLQANPGGRERTLVPGSGVSGPVPD